VTEIKNSLKNVFLHVRCRCRRSVDRSCRLRDPGHAGGADRQPLLPLHLPQLVGVARHVQLAPPPQQLPRQRHVLDDNLSSALVLVFSCRLTFCLGPVNHRHHRRVAGESRCVVAPPCPRSTARLQRSPIGRVESFRSWSSHSSAFNSPRHPSNYPDNTTWCQSLEGHWPSIALITESKSSALARGTSLSRFLLLFLSCRTLQPCLDLGSR